MKITTESSVPVYTIAGEGTSRPLPEWLARKRKRSLKKDSEYANRVELLQDFEFEEASQCVRVSGDGEWVVSTGTYKPQIHTHYLPHLSLSFARHTNTINQSFVLLSSDSSKSLHLQTDRFLEFHTQGGVHYTTRIPRYGRDLKYNRRSAEALVPTVGVNGDGNGEVFRLNLEVGRFMKAYEVDVGGDDFASMGGGALQGGIRTGGVNCAAVAEDSHGLLAFGTSIGTVEFWDSRSRNRVSALGPQTSTTTFDTDGTIARSEITALEFHPSGLNLATGDSNGIILTFDMRSPAPLFRKVQGHGSSVHTLKYLTSPSASSAIAPDKLLGADKKTIKVFDSSSSQFWTSVEPAVDLNHVEWVPDSGMLLTANEGRQQHAFFIPQLGPAPKWCGFLDNLVEEMAEDGEGFTTTNKSGAGEIYDNYKFVDQHELRDLNLDHLLSSSTGQSILRPYMHGYFVPQALHEQARLLANPDLAQQQRQKSIQAKLDKERESRIRGNSKLAKTVKVNRKLAEKLAGREEANERRKAQRLLRKAERDGDELPSTDAQQEEESAEVQKPATTKQAANDLMADDRFQRLFEDEDFEIDEASREFQMLNPSSATTAPIARGLTAVEDEAMDARPGSDSDDDEEDGAEDAQAEAVALRARQQSRARNRGGDDEEASKGRVGSTNYKKSGHRSQMQTGRQQQRSGGPRMQVSSSNGDDARRQRARQSQSFGDLASDRRYRGVEAGRGHGGGGRDAGVVGEKEVTFAPALGGKKGGGGKRGQRAEVESGEAGRQVARGKETGWKDRRSASGNTFRKM